MRRVVVTGLGVVSPLGIGVGKFWGALIKGESGIRSVIQESEGESQRWDQEERKRLASLPSTIAGIVSNFDPSLYMTPKEYQDIPLFIQYAMAATEEALTDANWKPQENSDRERTGVTVGSGIGSISDVVNTSRNFDSHGFKKVNPYFVPRILVNMSAGNISIKYQFYGPNHAASTACATGAHSIGDAYRLIQRDEADVMIAGGCESSIDSLSIAGFSKMRALSTKWNDKPKEASRPFDSKRNGFVISEGAGIVVLEEYEHAIKRGAKIYAEIIGYGLSGDGYHITSPSSNGRGAILSMKSALRVGHCDSKRQTFDIDKVDYVNAHATSTPIGDAVELAAISHVFEKNRKNKIQVSSIKGSIGHLLGASGSVEAISTILTIKNDIIPPTLNLENPDPTGKEIIEHVANVSKNQTVNAAMTNSFGFGGTNASLLFKKLDFQ